MAASATEEVPLLPAGGVDGPQERVSCLSKVAVAAMTMAAVAAAVHGLRGSSPSVANTQSLVGAAQSLPSTRGHPASRQRAAKEYLLQHLAQAAQHAKKDACLPGEGTTGFDTTDKELMAAQGYGSIGQGANCEGHTKTMEQPPVDYGRDRTIYEQCACGKGLDNIAFWPQDQRMSNVAVKASEEKWVRWGKGVTNVTWFCSGMSFTQTTEVQLGEGDMFSIKLDMARKDTSCCSGDLSGLIHMNTWKEAEESTSVPFSSGSDGFACFKVPALLVTNAGTFIAFAEGRRGNCSDCASTELVYKRSADKGRTWGALQVLVQVPAEDRQRLGLCGNPLVVGNVAPVQLRAHSRHHPGRILAPYTRNNFKAWLIHSDDDGVTWEGDHELEGMTVTAPGVDYAEAAPECDRDMAWLGYQDLDAINPTDPGDLMRLIGGLCTFGVNPYTNPEWMGKMSGPWQWVGTGPPGSLQLRSGRVLVPSYNSFIRGLTERFPGDLPFSQSYNNFALGHTMISDDGGDTWKLSSDWEMGQGANENQMVELPCGTVISNSRSLSISSPQYRVQAKSTNQGMNFTASELTSLPQPFGGCQGSAISGRGRTVYVSGPDPGVSSSLLQQILGQMQCDINATTRKGMSVWESKDGAESYSKKALVDTGRSGYSSLQRYGGELYLLYEQADDEPRFNVDAGGFQEALQDVVPMVPDRFVFRHVGK